MYVAIREQEKMPMHLEKQVQIKVEAQIRGQFRALLFNTVLTIVPMECFDYSNVFLEENVADF